MVDGSLPVVAARDRLAGLLADLEAAGSFCARRTAPPDDLLVEVRGVGSLRFPVPKEQARQLIRAARPARYGLGEATLVDPKVRDTWEVPKSRVRIDQRRWNRTLLPVLDRLRADLGLGSGCRLKAELHSMLVYGPGQFFVPHQDTERSDAMVGSLVVTLPGPFTGGGLVVSHGAERRTYRSSKDRLTLVAFYADCRHEIKPVRSGYRIVLTYDLSVLGDTAGSVPEVPRGTVDALGACLQEHFSTPVPPPSWRRDRAPSPPPDRLVYLLDHEYTERGLSGTKLKGADAVRAGALHTAAAMADCEVVLALADISETWSAYELAGRGGAYWRSRYRQWDEDDDDDDEEDADDDPGGDYELEELIESSVSLDHWSDWSGGRAERIVSSVGDHEVCATTPTNQFEPYASEYEPYMGNYGNTLDRQYRRAALVLWPRQRTFAVRAEASPLWALGEVAARLRAGTIDEARQMATTLQPFWPSAARGDQRGLFTRSVRVAAGLDDPELAEALLAPFHLEVVSKRDAAGLAALVERYGGPWLAAVVSRWSGGDRYRAGGERVSWVAALPPLCAALHARGGAGTAAASALVGTAHGWLVGAVESRRRIERSSLRDDALKELARPVLGVLESAVVVGARDRRDELLRVVRGDGGEVLLPCLIEVVRVGSKLDAPVRAAAGLDEIAEHCARLLEARLSRPARAEGDWSIDLPRGCGCELCATLGSFLADPTERTREWPLAQERRRHVHGRIDAGELPVRHQTRRSGRPYTLVLTKTTDVFQREVRQRRRDEEDLRSLRAGPGQVPTLDRS